MFDSLHQEIAIRFADRNTFTTSCWDITPNQVCLNGQPIAVRYDNTVFVSTPNTPEDLRWELTKALDCELIYLDTDLLSIPLELSATHD